MAINEAADRADFSINEQLIVRALGPTLTNFGITGALADPTLSLLDANGTPLAFNVQPAALSLSAMISQYFIGGMMFQDQLMPCNRA